jgi:signal transduction histidine kinase/CheY-like chemotaxis protein
LATLNWPKGLSPPALTSGYAEERRRQILVRLRLSVWIAIGAIPLAAVLNLLTFTDHIGERLSTFGLEMVLSLVVVLLMGRDWGRRHPLLLALGFMLSMCAVLLWAISISSRDLDVLVGTIIATMIGSALLFPWGAPAQSVVSLFLAIGYLAILPWDELAQTRVVNALLGLTDGVVLSIVGAFILDRQRRTNVRLLEKNMLEAKISAALARVGQALISSLDMPVILDRLCRMTTEVMECDASHTLLWRTEERAFVPVSFYGEPEENAETLRVLRFPPDKLHRLLERLESDDVAQFVLAELSEPSRRVGHQLGNTVLLLMALRRGGEVIGLHTAAYRGRTEPFRPEQERIARGIAHLASMALENARLADELERAVHLKSEFVATMSHELRTPLNIIVGYGDLLLDGEFGSLTAEQADVHRRMAKNSRQLLELINSTLDLSRLEAGRLPVTSNEIALSDLLDELDVETKELRDKPGVSFVWRVASDLPRIETDSLKLKVILKNLVTNALKFTDEGSVTVDAEVHGEGIEISVRDTGIGISRQAREIIFEPFRQVESAMTRHHGGVGLGLYIVRRLLELLGGTIAVESEEGRGSTFRVRLPIRYAQCNNQGIEVAATSGLSPGFTEDTRQGAGDARVVTAAVEVESSNGKRTTVAGNTPKKILVVDDEYGVRRSIRMLLEGEGFTVVEAQDGRCVIDTVRTEGIDLVITDLIMPEEEGFETIRALQAQHREVPIIAVSGALRDDYLKTAYWLGARRTFRKPFETSALLEAVREELATTYSEADPGSHNR